MVAGWHDIRTTLCRAYDVVLSQWRINAISAGESTLIVSWGSSPLTGQVVRIASWG